MKKTFVISVMALAAGICTAQEMGRVISTTPVMQQMAVPRQVCSNEQVVVQGTKSGAGVAMGAIAGGALGNAVGSGGGRALATFIGLIGGAMLGDRVEGGAPSQVQNVRNCNTQTFLENRVVAYNVLYEYAGKQYSVQMPNDPGPSIRVQVTPVGSVPRDGGNQYGGGASYRPAVQAPVTLNTYRAAPDAQYGGQAIPPYSPIDTNRNAPLSGGEVNSGN